MLIGPKGSGKTTIGTLVHQHTDITFIRVEPIWLDLQPDEDGWKKVECPMTRYLNIIGLLQPLRISETWKLTTTAPYRMRRFWQQFKLFERNDFMKVYIAGVMQGSIKGKGIQKQNYRQRIREAVKIHHPDAEIFDPFRRFPDSVEYDNQRARQVLFELAAEAASSDLLIAYLPEASMGTAMEMIRAYDNGKPIISISPMTKNWLILALSKKIFSTLDEFCDWVGQARLSELIER
jgi:hypothetical protein